MFSRSTVFWVVALGLTLGEFAIGRALSPPMIDEFADVRLPGQVAGSTANSGGGRLVLDQAGTLAIEGGSLRLPPPSTNAWGFQGISYGPFSVVPGLSMAARIRLGDVLIWDERDSARLAVGWFSDVAPVNPRVDSLALILGQSLGGRRGALYASGLDLHVPVVDPVMQLDMQIVAVCRNESVMLYAASVWGARGLSPYPAMRPVAILPLDPARLFAGIHQRSQRDTNHATLVDGIRVAIVPEWADWSGTAAWSDIRGAGAAKLSFRPTNTPPAMGAPELIGTWTRVTSQLYSPAGLITARVESEGNPGRIAFIFRAIDGFNHWRLELDGAAARLIRVVRSHESVVAENRNAALTSGVSHRIWVTDDGTFIRVWRDKEILLGITDTTWADGVEVGFAAAAGGGLRLHHFEAHLREILIASGLRLGEPYQRRGVQVVLKDNFAGAANSLIGRKVSTAAVWERHGGPEPDEIELTGAGAGRCNHENSAVLTFLLPWSHPEFADVSVEVIPPAPPAEGHAGVALWQNDQNFLLGGFDTPSNRYGVWCVRDGRWTPVDLGVPTIPLGMPHRIRLSCNGDDFAVWQDTTALVVGRIRDYFPGGPALRIRRVGIGLTRFERKGDQGTLFRNFEARWSAENAPVGPPLSDWKRPGNGRRGALAVPIHLQEPEGGVGEFGGPPPGQHPTPGIPEKRPEPRSFHPKKF
ncbi:MAG: hypothetical protein EXS36_00655 [Pedosphaera sp.]|nr:hypothetical protein [Pedosphaera sp.]